MSTSLVCVGARPAQTWFMAFPRVYGLTAFALLGACTTAPTDVLVSLAPDVVSSLSGTLSVRATVVAEREPVSGEPVQITLEYEDRGGTPHVIAPVEGTTDEKGVFEATISGLTWDGTGTVIATGSGIEGSASFSVLDRTPPKVTISPPLANLVRRGQDITVKVRVTDEIGVSQASFGSSDQDRERSLIASGATDVMFDFDFTVPDLAPGAMVTLFALADDLSGNQGAAAPITVTVVP